MFVKTFAMEFVRILEDARLWAVIYDGSFRIIYQTCHRSLGLLMYIRQLWKPLMKRHN
jgi:hypothetical protein